jgi:YHS domain-containing protein
MRLFVYAVVAIVIFVILAPILRGWRPRGPMTARRTQRDELVKDPVCQTYVVLSRAVSTEADGAITHFCSRECAARYARGERRR